MARVAAFFSDPAWVGSHSATIYDRNGALLDTLTISPGMLPGYVACGNTYAPAPGVVCGAFVGFDQGSNVIGKIQFGPSLTGWPTNPTVLDAFAIDDLRWEQASDQIPEPATSILLGAGFTALAAAGSWRRRRS